MPLNLTQPYILLCEGVADQAFFRVLARDVCKLPIDIPFPPDNYDNIEEKYRRKLHGKDGFGLMLEALDNYFLIAPERMKEIRGILVTFDARDNGVQEIANVTKQFPSVFGRPERPLVPAGSGDGRPPIAVMPVPPHLTAGGLETICIEAVKETYREIVGSLEQCLNSDPIQIRKWPAETRDKARLACIVAVTNKDDPTKSLRWSFGPSGSIVDVTLRCFDPIARSLAEFKSAVDALR